MIKSLKSLAAAIGILGFATIIAWVYLRGSSLAKPVRTEFNHPFLSWLESHPGCWVAEGGDAAAAPADTMPAFESAVAENPDNIIWIDVRPTLEGELVAFRDRDLSSTTNGKGWINFTPYDEVAKLNVLRPADSTDSAPLGDQRSDLHVPRLEDVLKRVAPPTHFVLYFRGNQPGYAQKIVESIERTGVSDRALIASPEDRLLEELRELKPSWVFSTSLAQMTQLKMLISIGLEGMAPVKGDVAVMNPEMPARGSLARTTLYQVPRPMVAELHRRHVKILIGPIHNRAEWLQLRDDGVDGFVTDRIAELRKQL